MKFQNWTPELAYFLGWMITDGYVSPQGIHVEIASKDKESLDHLHKWIPESFLLGPYKRIKDGKETESFRLSVYGAEVKEIFSKQWGISDNKTGREHIPFEVPEKIVPHLFRGLFDGDGGCTERDNNKHESYFVSSSRKLLEDIRDIHGGNKGRKIRTKKELKRKKKNGEARRFMYAWEFGKKESRKLRDLIYVDGYYGMSRKKEKMFRLF